VLLSAPDRSTAVVAGAAAPPVRAATAMMPADAGL